MPQLKLTETAIGKIEKPDKLEFYFDTELKGFGVYVTAHDVRTYFVKGRVNGRQVKYAIAQCNLMTLKKARVEAQKRLAEMKEGINPQLVRRQKKIVGMTFSDIFDGFLKERNNLKPGTILTYRKLVNYHLNDWLNKPIAEITPEMVAARHDRITKKSGKAPANNAMRTFRAIYNYALGITDKKIPENPTSRLTVAKSWHKIERRRSIISNDELPRWFEAVSAIKEDCPRTYLLLLLFTGLRREEAASLKWQNVDFSSKTIKVDDTKNNKPHLLPLSEYLFNLLQELRNSSTADSPFVFPGEGKKGYISAPSRTISRIKEQTGKQFCIHDLRRTFSTIAENLVSYSTVKRLLNHSTENDVTQGYLIFSVEALRESMEKISNRILFLVEPKDTHNVIDFVGYKKQLQF